MEMRDTAMKTRSQWDHCLVLAAGFISVVGGLTFSPCRL